MKKTPLLLLLMLSLLACEKQPVEPVTTGTVKDHEGNQYKIKTYGTQTWMVENMKATTTKDGKNILKCPANGQFSYDEPMAYYLLDDKEYLTRGRGCLYNYAAAQEICPDGWHLPSVSDWNTLMDYVAREYTGRYNDDTITLVKALASQTEEWASCDLVVGAPGYHRVTNNSSGFGIRPLGGYFTLSGTTENPDFHSYRYRAAFWTSSLTNYSFDNAYTIILVNDRDSVMVDGRTQFQAYNVRCVKNN